MKATQGNSKDGHSVKASQKLAKDQMEDESIEELEKSLGTHYHAYYDYQSRAQLNFTPPGTQGKSKDKPMKHFYFPPKIPFLQDPEKQRIYRKKFIADVSATADPEPLVLIGDVMHHELLSTIGDRSHPTVVKDDMACFFKRRLAQLEVRKLKMIQRWSFHSRMSVPDLERIGNVLDRQLGGIQQEIDLTVNRIERLTGEDNFGTLSSQRPVPSTQDENDPSKQKRLYEEKNDVPTSSLIREDDIEVYLRIQTYRNKLFRMFDKFIYEMTWLPYLSRFEIWEHSRILIQDYKHQTYEKHDSLKKMIGQNIKLKLEENGIIEERIVQAVMDKFTKYIKGPDGGPSLNMPRLEYLMNSHKANHERAPLLTSTIVEMKIQLSGLASQFSINGDLDIDNGHMFTYRVQVMFPTYFAQQSLLLTFDLYDTSKENDYANIERIVKNIEQSSSSDKVQALNVMKSTAIQESKKSIVGKMSADNLKQRVSNDNQRLDNAARENNIGEAFFTLDVSQFKLKSADWLSHVTFEGTVSEAVKRQSIYFNQVDQYDSLLESAFNFLDINDISSVNRILEDSANNHVQRAQLRNQTRSEIANITEDQELENYLKASLLKSGQARSEEQQRKQLQDFKEQIKGAEKPLHLSDPIPSNMIKSYYSLRLLKTREHKIKLLHSLNFFRSVQKRLSYDLKEILSRSRNPIDPMEAEVIQPQFEKSEQLDQMKFQEDTTGGPGNLFMNHSKRETDGDINIEDPVTFKVVKHNNRFSPLISSTCPCIPRQHVTFERKRLYEKISDEYDKGTLTSRQMLKRVYGMQDKWEVDEDSQDVTVEDEFGVKVIYKESLNDMLEIEEELIKVGSYFMQQTEILVNSDIKDPACAVDRGEVTLNLYQSESEFQFHKVLLLQRYMEAYEHCTDPLEVVRLTQVIADLMVQRPRLNVEGAYFTDCYRNEIEVLKEKSELLRELADMQIDKEQCENEEIRNVIELKNRKLHDFIQKKWLYEDTLRRDKHISAAEEEQHRRLAMMNSQNDASGMTMEDFQKQVRLDDEVKKKRILEIARRHITEFIDNQYADFEEILDMPSAAQNAMNSKSGHVLDPNIVDMLKEFTFYSKQKDGYSSEFEKDPFNQYTLFGAKSHRVGVLDFYDSLSTFSKIEASIQQGLSELILVHMPENGLAVAALERALLCETRSRLKILRAGVQSAYASSESAKILESDLYFGHSDKLMFLAKEFKAHLSPDLIKFKANPLLVGKLDVKVSTTDLFLTKLVSVKNVAKFDFPRVKQKDVISPELEQSMTPDQVLRKMIDTAKLAVTKDEFNQEINDKKKAQKDVEGVFSFEKDDDEKIVVEGPSLLHMTCNIVEAIRLREEIIHKVHQSDVLTVIYKRQLALVNKSNMKLILSDSINFDVSKVLTDCMNLIDFNDGSKLDFELPFREFDYTLRSGLDFNSDSCIKALMTDLGVEELRAVLHYQMMQLQLLQIGVMINQALMDGSCKALSEIELLSRKRPFTIPSSLLNIQAIIMKTTEGNMGETLSKERNRFKQILSREVGEVIFLIDGKKSKLRSAKSSKFASSLNRLGNSSLSTEVKLRLLRSQRIRLLHCFCKEILKEAYQDVLKVQILSANSKLRQFTALFQKEENFFEYGMGAIQENLPFSFLPGKQKITEEEAKTSQSQARIQSILSGEMIFYIPSSEEVMNLDPLNKPHAVDNILPGGDMINEELIDSQIKDIVKMPTEHHHYKLDDGIARSIRMATIKEAYGQSSSSFKLLNFLTLLYRNLKLKFLMIRNSSSALDVLELEDSVLNGRSFWTESITKDRNAPQQMGQDASERVIQRIIQRKKGKQALAEELQFFGKRTRSMNLWLSKSYASNAEMQNGKFERIINLLGIHNQIIFNRFLIGIDQALDTYLDQDNNELFGKVMSVRDQLTRKVPVLKRFYENGSNLNQLSFQSSQVDLRQRSLSDNRQHDSVYSAYVDEQLLVPSEIRLVRSIFSKHVQIDNLCFHTLSRPSMRDYSYLENTFYNISDKQREYMYTNFQSLDDKLKAYLKFKKVSLEENTITQILNRELEYLAIEVEARQVQHVMLCWFGKSDIPHTTKEYKALYKKYKDHTVLRIIAERDVIVKNERLKMATEGERRKKKEQTTLSSQGSDTIDSQEPLLQVRKTDQQLPYGQPVDNESLREAIALSETMVNDEHFFSTLCERKAEIQISRRLLETSMMNMAIRTLSNEHSSMLAAFHNLATEQSLQLYIHPSQQYCQTLVTSALEEPPHLDISNKIACVQQFITKLRNRCTEVETLTSGTGIVFSLKDFNDCLQTMCRNLLKYSEQELYHRVESSAIKENQYRHLLYLKDQQGLYYRRKCEHLLLTVDKLVNAKLTQRGSQIVYELDQTQRELRVLKDNVFLMERLLRQELRHEYERDITERDIEISKYKDSFHTYKSDLNNQIKEEVAIRLTETQQDINLLFQKKMLEGGASPVRGEQHHPRTSGIMTQSKANFFEFQVIANQAEKGQGYYTQESMKEINSMNRFIRLYKVFTQLKEVIAKEKHDRELALQRKTLSANAGLWDQLAEAEKRESIVRQELYFSQQNNQTYEKIIGKLQHQLETIQSEKMRLMQFKSAKSKQIEAMETKMKDVEILENIDLQKIIEELKSREAKLKRLSVENMNFNSRMEQVQNANVKKVAAVRNQLQKERTAKAQAFDQLDGFRLEIKAIEGKDLSSHELWKQKCKELFEICKDLQNENEELKSLVTQQALATNNLAPESNQYSVLGSNEDIMSKGDTQHPHMNGNISQLYYASGPNPLTSFERRDKSGHNNMAIHSSSGGEHTTKPSTAVGKRMIGGSRQGPRQNQNSNQYLLSGGKQLHDVTLTSGMSLPEIMMGQDMSEDTSRSPLSSLNIKSGFKDNSHFSGMAANGASKSREMNRPTNLQQSNNNQQMHMLNSTDMMSSQGGIGGGNLYSSGGASSEIFNTRHTRRVDNVRQSKGKVSIRTGDALNFGGDGSEGDLTASQPNHPLMMIGGNNSFKTSVANARSQGGIIFNTSGNTSQSQSRGSGLVNNVNIPPSQFQGKKQRLMTSQGPRRGGQQQVVQDQSTTVTLQSSHIPNLKDSASLRKSGMLNSSTSRAYQLQQKTSQNQSNLQLNNHTSANLAAGLSIANASLPFGAGSILGSGPVRGQAINMNFNFNTTNINMNK